MPTFVIMIQTFYINYNNNDLHAYLLSTILYYIND